MLSRRKTHVITNAVTKDNDGGKLGCGMLALHIGGSRYECTKDETGRKYNGFHLGKWDEKIGILQVTPAI